MCLMELKKFHGVGCLCLFSLQRYILYKNFGTCNGNDEFIKQKCSKLNVPLDYFRQNIHIYCEFKYKFSDLDFKGNLKFTIIDYAVLCMPFNNGLRLIYTSLFFEFCRIYFSHY